jgi:hypothetical protein
MPERVDGTMLRRDDCAQRQQGALENLGRIVY